MTDVSTNLNKDLISKYLLDLENFRMAIKMPHFNLY